MPIDVFLPDPVVVKQPEPVVVDEVKNDYSALDTIVDQIAPEGTADLLLCAICLENLKSVTLRTCDHFCACATCLKKMRENDQIITCPICRKVAKKLSHVIIS